MKKINYLLGYKNLKIVQDDDKFKFSLDSVLLSHFATIHLRYKNILDIGTGNAPIPLILSTRTNAHIDGVEIQKESYDMAIESVEINNLCNQISIYNEDIKTFCSNHQSDFYDSIVCNPPYFKFSDESLINKSDEKTIARHEKMLTLEEVCKISRKLLKNNGTLSIVNRPERLVDILLLMRKNNIEPKKIQFVFPKKEKDANILLVEGKKNGSPGIEILEPLIVYDSNNEYTKEILKYFE